MPTPEFAASFGRLAANHLWQSTGFGAVAALLAVALRVNHARARYWLWMAASVKFLIPFSALAAIGGSLGRWLTPAAPISRVPLVMEQFVQPFTPAQFAPIPATASAPAPDLLPSLLVILWLGGFAAVLLYAWLRWRRVAAAVRASTPFTEWGGRSLSVVCHQGLAKTPTGHKMRWPVPLVSSAAKLEPGVFGIFRPVIWLPAGIGGHLDDAELEAILAHELCHIRRHDNLLASIHMLVEGLFWFHPLVWWLGARLEEERERACDEEVVRVGGEPQVYAESILKVVEFYLASPVACAAGVSGGELKKRIEGIMTNQFARKLSFGKKLLLAVAALLALAVPIAIGLLNPVRSRAQEARLEFDAASVKPDQFPTVNPKFTPGRLTWSATIEDLVEAAYQVEPFRITGLIPDRGAAYRLDAAFAPTATPEQVRLMLQSLLEDRFKMVSHRVTKEFKGYSLTVAKGGPKIQEAKDGDQPALMPESLSGGPPRPAGWDGQIINHMPEAGVVEFIGRRVTMLQLCEELRRSLGTAVWDQTGLKGNYYFVFRFAAGNAPVEADAPPLAAALRTDLGLHLEKHNGPMETLAIDHIEKTPTEN